MRELRIAAIFLAVLLTAAQQPSKTLKLSPQGYVNDFANVLNLETKQKIETLCGEVDQKAHAQIAIVTVNSLNGESVDQFSIDLAMGWGIGPKGTKRGVLILLAPSERKYRIEVGYGLEAILPDGKVGSIGREAVPLLRDSNYNGAVLLMTQRVAETIAADQKITLATPTPPEVPSTPAPRSSRGINPTLIIWGIVILFWLIGFIIRQARGNNRGRRSGSFVGPWFFGGGGFGGGGFSSGGSWGGGGGGGGGGFGGFGGGSFGGGGASGSW